jgi:hypothetical protein
LLCLVAAPAAAAAAADELTCFLTLSFVVLLLLQIKEEPMDGEEPAAAAGDADSSSPGELADLGAQLQLVAGLAAATATNAALAHHPCIKPCSAVCWLNRSAEHLHMHA